MNIFYLDKDVKKCAEYHNSSHVVKMILESCQLLSTAHRFLDGSKNLITKKYEFNDDRDKILYKATHINHPSSIWVRYSSNNYQWLHSLLVELSKEYIYRYGKTHKCQQIGLIKYLSKLPDNIIEREFTEPTPAMPVEYIISGDYVKSYRKYYIESKQHLAKWNGKVGSRDIPEWYNIEI